MNVSRLSRFVPRTLSHQLPPSFAYPLPLAILLFLATALFPFFNVSSNKAFAAPHINYNCGTRSANHCYATVTWPGGANAADMRFTIPRFGNGGNGFLTHEMWIVSNANTFWVEVGEAVGLSGGATNHVLFWADNRPNGGGFHLHIGPTLNNNDLNKSFLTRIFQSGSDRWEVFINNGVHSLSGTSTSNNFVPKAIIVGSELAVTSGAVGPNYHFTNNRWSINGGSTWNLQTSVSDDNLRDDPPQFGNWNPLVPNGGDWRTCILGSGC